MSPGAEIACTTSLRLEKAREFEEQDISEENSSK